MTNKLNSILELEVDNKKKFVYITNDNHNASIFFNACANNDANLIHYCLENCSANLSMTEFIDDYKSIFKCKKEKCHQYNCLSENFPCEEKITPLMYAILKENFYAVKYLLTLDKNIVNYQTKCLRMTPLLLACRIRNFDIIKLLYSKFYIRILM